MQRLRTSVVFAFAAWAVAVGVLAAPASARVSTYSGQYLCDDRGVVTPLDGMNVELWERGSPDFLPVEIVGHRVDRDYTDSSGGYSMTTENNDDDYFVRMALRDAHGVHLRDFWGINDWSEDLPERHNDHDPQLRRPHLQQGGQVPQVRGLGRGHMTPTRSSAASPGPPCRAGGVEIVADSVGEVPFTPGTSMYWTNDYPVGYDGGGDDSTTKHEFAHAMRHGLDGDFGHFIGDAATFNYAQSHSACDHQNLGFAFNEGWAEFWAGRYGDAPDCGRPGDYETEGNVAAALTTLMENCAGGQKKIMVETLRNNPLRIHSYQEFQAALGCPIPKLFPVGLIAAELGSRNGAAVAPRRPGETRPPGRSRRDRHHPQNHQIGAGGGSQSEQPARAA